MKELLISNKLHRISSGKLHAISAHRHGRHYDLEKWSQYGDKKQKTTGKLGRWRFVGCYNNFEELAKNVLNMQINDETAKDMQSMVDAWKDAVAEIVESLERNVQ